MHSGFLTSTGQSNDNRYCIMPKRFESIVKQLLYSLILLIHSSALGQSNSIHISEPNPDSNKELAFVLYEQNDFTRAALLLEDIVEANPRDELSYRRYIQCLIKTNQQEKAIKFIKKRIYGANSKMFNRYKG